LLFFHNLIYYLNERVRPVELFHVLLDITWNHMFKMLHSAFEA